MPMVYQGSIKNFQWLGRLAKYLLIVRLDIAQTI
jgi:hypothetical protein